MLSDTDPRAEQVQIELLRRASVAERLGLAFSLTASMVNLSRQTIAELHPDFGPHQLNIKCVELYYGKELAAHLRDYLDMERHDVAL